MAYATAEQFVETVTLDIVRLIARDVEAVAGWNLGRVEEALASASAEADSYLATRFSVPLNPVPAIVEVVTIALAEEALDRGGRDHVKAAAARHRAWLRDVAKGVATLGVNVGSPEAPAGGGDDGGVAIDAPARVFDDRGLAPFLRGC